MMVEMHEYLHSNTRVDRRKLQSWLTELFKIKDSDFSSLCLQPLHSVYLNQRMYDNWFLTLYT